MQPAGGAGTLAGEFLPALALARRGTRTASDGFNFRSGAFSRHGESTALRSRLFLLAGIVGAALLIFSASAGLRWWSKAQGAEALKQELTALYRQAIPGQGAIVDVTLQLRAHLAELTRSSRPGGQHPLAAAGRDHARSLQPHAAGDPGHRARMEYHPRRDPHRSLCPLLRCRRQDCRRPRRFSPLPTVQVTDAKSSADNSKVDFRLTLTSKTGEELP